MGLEQFQEAICELTRLPEVNRREKFQDFRRRFSLSAHEEQQLRKLSEDPNVVKYGRAMAFVRRETIEKQMPYSKYYIEEEVLDYISRYLFDATAPKVRFRHLGLSFLNFLASDAKAKRVLDKECPPFIHEIVRFERAQARVRLEHKETNLPVPEGSLLLHRAFQIDDYEYKISEYVLKVANVPKTELKEKAPVKGNETLLVIPKYGSTHCRFFEVDSKLEDFLQSQIDSPTLKVIPDEYAALVDLGLCRKSV